MMINKKFILLFLSLFFLPGLNYAIAKKPPLENVVVIIDPGHGGKDPGAIAYKSEAKEKDLNLVRAIEFAGILKTKFGAEVKLTRKLDEFQSLPERPAIANELQEKYKSEIKTVLFISIHHNASKDKKGHGTETYYNNINENKEEAVKLASAIQSELGKTKFSDRGVKIFNHQVTRELELGIWGILTEICFIDNKDDWKQYKALRKNRVADALTIGVLRYLDKIKSYTIQAESEDNVFQGTITDDGWVRIDEEEKPVLISSHGVGKLVNPLQIAIDKNDNVYVTDYYQNAIWMLYPEEKIISKQVGRNPYGLAIDDNNNFYVSDQWGHQDKIIKLNSSGDIVLTFAEGGHHYAGVAVDENDYVYVTDSYTNEIKKYTSNGDLVEECPIPPWGQRPWGLDAAVDGNGNLYITLLGWRTPQIAKFDSEFNLVKSWGIYGTGDGEFQWALGLATDNEGNLLVADTDNLRIQKFTPEGEFIMKWNSGWPVDVEVDSSDNIYVLDSYPSRVQKFTITVPLEGEITTPLINFPDLFSYIGIVSTEEITISTAQSISYEYSTDGNVWYDVPADGIVMEADTDTKDIQFRVTLKRKEGYDSPALDKVVVEYVDWGSGSSENSVQSGGGSVVGAMSAAGALDENAEDKFKAGEVYVFPNPAKQTEPTFRLEYTNADRVELAVYNIAAELIYAKEVNSPPDIYEYTLNTRDIPSGVYIYVVRAIKDNMEMDRKMKKFALIK